MGSGAIERQKVATADRRIGPCEEGFSIENRVFPSELCFALFSLPDRPLRSTAGQALPGRFQHMFVTAGSTASRVIARLRAGGGLVISSNSFFFSRCNQFANLPSRMPSSPHATASPSVCFSRRAGGSPADGRRPREMWAGLSWKNYQRTAP